MSAADAPTKEQEDNRKAAVGRKAGRTAPKRKAQRTVVIEVDDEYLKEDNKQLTLPKQDATGVWQWDGIEVKDTHSSRGKGLFATRDIPEGSVPAIYVGRIRNESFSGTYVLGHIFSVMDEDGKVTRHEYTIDATPDEKQHPGLYAAAYVNEPCPDAVANCRVVPNPIIELGFCPMYVVTARTIKAGEELTWYYGKKYTRDYPIGTALPESLTPVGVSAKQARAVVELYDRITPGLTALFDRCDNNNKRIRPST